MYVQLMVEERREINKREERRYEGIRRDLIRCDVISFHFIS